MLFALALSGKLDLVPQRRAFGSGAAIALLALAGIAGDQDYSSGGTVTTTISEARQVKPAVGAAPDQGPVREATLTVAFADIAEAEGSSYVSTVAWQGGGMISDQMEKIAPGVYRTTRAIPLGGAWKTIVRLQSGRRLLAAPVQLPGDPGIPVGSHVNPGTETLQLKTEQQYLQRERKRDVPASLWLPAMIGVLGLMGTFSIGLGFATARVGLRTTREPAASAATASPDDRPAPSGNESRGTRPSTTGRVAYGPSDR
jgi:hypothetical protein